MAVLLSVLDIYLLLWIHAKVLGQGLTLKKLVIAIGRFYALTLLFVGVFEFAGWEYTIGGLLIYPTYFILQTLSMGKLDNRVSLLLFYSLFPLGFWDVVKNFIGYFIVYNHPVLYNLYQTSLGGSLFSLFAKIVVLVLISIFQYDFSHLKTRLLDKRTRFALITANVFMLIYFVLPPYLSYIHQEVWEKMTGYKESLTAIYFLLFICFVNILDRNLRQELQEQVILQKEIQLQNINNYSKQVEGLYQEIRSFRHDYANILTSLKLGIDKKDLQLISDIYDSVLKESGKTLKGERFEVARLVNVQDLPLKSLLLSKLAEAQSLSIPISLEVEAPIAISHIEQIDLLTIVAILLDNALEAAAEAGDKARLAICLFEDRRLNKQVLIIQNATAEREVDLARIFERGVSSKVGERGLGLANVTDILKAYPNISLRTTSQHFTFTQVLEIDP